MSTKPFAHIASLLVLGLFLLAPVYANGTDQEPGYPPPDAPEIVLVVPEECTAGTIVSIEGRRFADQVKVWLGDIDLGVCEPVSSELLIIEIPEIPMDANCDDGREYRLMDITIKNLSDHQHGWKSHALKYWPSCPDEEGWPSIDVIEPDAGTEGTHVTIYGDNFDDDMLVFFGWMPAWPVEVVSATELHVEAPRLWHFRLMDAEHSPSAVSVNVTVVNLQNGLWDMVRDGFTYQSNEPELVVHGVEPDEGPSGIEATVIVEGFGEDVAVYFGECEADILARPSPEEIVVRVPEWCYPELWDDEADDDEWDDDEWDDGEYDDGEYDDDEWDDGEWDDDDSEWDDDESDDSEYDDDEWLEDERFEPEGYDKWSGENGCDDDETSPQREHTVSVTVVDFDTDLSATKRHAFTYVLDVRPVVEDVEPRSGPPGILATITVRGFSEAVSVYFGGCAAPVVERPSLEEIVVEVPPHAPVVPLPFGECVFFKAEGLSTDDEEPDDWHDHDDDTCTGPTVSVTVIDLVTGAQAAKQRAFTYVLDPMPIVESVDPDKGYPGMLTTVTVRGFSEAVSVYFGVYTALIVERPSLEEIVVEVPLCPLEHPGDREPSGADIGSEWCDDGEIGWRQQCSGESSWHKVCVTVVDLLTGAYGIAPHAFNYVPRPDEHEDEHDPAVGVLVVRDVELRQGYVDVQIPILLDYHSMATDGVSSILFALAYDRDHFEITDVEVGEAAASAGKNVDWNVAENGLLYVTVTGGNQAIPQGEVCVLHASISTEAGRGVITKLRFEELSAASPDEDELVLEGRPGTVRVGMSYDVNDDWTVDAVDVQFVINSALHVAPQGSEEMMMSDGDDDGDVDAVDIQRAINKALMLF